MNRSDFDSSRPVELLQMCFTGTVLQVLYPGTYSVDQLPDSAFTAGIVRQPPLPQPEEPAAPQKPKPLVQKEKAEAREE